MVCLHDNLPVFVYLKTHFKFTLVADVTTRFDQVFWFGDFNFRLSEERADVEAIMSRIVGSDMGPLLEHDQLSKELNDGMFACNRLDLCENL